MIKVIPLQKPKHVYLEMDRKWPIAVTGYQTCVTAQ